jgi:hypothetical protein
MKRDWWEVLRRLPIMLHCGTQAVLQQLEEDEVEMGGEAGERLQAPVQLYHIKGTISSQYMYGISHKKHCYFLTVSKDPRESEEPNWTFLSMRIRILILIKRMPICDHRSTSPSSAPF